MKSSEEISAEGGPAFAAIGPSAEQGGDGWPGMTLRDYFAGQALAGILAYEGTSPGGTTARMAYAEADEMLVARAAE